MTRPRGSARPGREDVGAWSDDQARILSTRLMHRVAGSQHGLQIRLFWLIDSRGESAGLESVTQVSNAVMRCFDLGVLARHDLLERWWQIVVHRFLKLFYRRVFTTFAFSEDRVLVATRHRGF